MCTNIDVTWRNGSSPPSWCPVPGILLTKCAAPCVTALTQGRHLLLKLALRQGFVLLRVGYHLLFCV
eukprot:Skav200464  [mRNA]  locus=scaffold1350:35747:38605:+ [translate_table: standard]